MTVIQRVFIGLVLLTAIPAAGFGQNGSDINQATPIYFGQTINDTIDSTTRPWQVYAIVVSKGQQITVTGTSNSPSWIVYLLNPSTTTIAGSFSAVAQQGETCSYGCGSQGTQGVSFNYPVATAGTYYVALHAWAPALVYTLQVTAQGTPITTPNPAQSGCLTGQVNSITYSLQLIAAGLPDTVSIGGTQMCASCTIKPPAYPALVAKMETAMGLGVGVSACYDGTGNIFQLTLNHP
jgi:hypothetical protein